MNPFRARGVIVLVLALACGGGGREGLVPAPEADTTSEWGAPSRGLSLRFTIPARFELGMSLDATIEVRCDPATLPRGVRQLNTFLVDAHVALHVSRPGSKDEWVFKPDAPTQGMVAVDDGHQGVALPGESLAPWKVRIPLRSSELVTGQWLCRVEFGSPETPPGNWHGSPEEWAAFGFWSGTVATAPVSIEIVEATPKTRTFQVPRELRLAKGEGGPIVTYGLEDTEAVDLPIKNGCFLGGRIYVDGRQRAMGGVRPFVPPEKSNPVDGPYGYVGGDIDRTYTLVIFETTSVPCHEWDPECGTYTILWQRTFRVRHTEREITALLGR